MTRPPAVRRALELAGKAGIHASSRDEEGLLLHVLASRRGLTRAGAIGTGSGIGAAWIVSALAPQVPFVAAELDPVATQLLVELFADDPNVDVLAGPWRQTLPDEAPFDLIFVDTPDAQEDPDAVVGLLTPGGTAVLAGIRPGQTQSGERRGAWLEHSLLAAVEVWATPERSVLLAVRR